MPKQYQRRRIRTKQKTTSPEGKKEYQRKYMRMRRRQQKPTDVFRSIAKAGKKAGLT